MIGEMREVNQRNIAACVTLYNSSMDCLACMETYRKQVQTIYVVDNSAKPDTALVEAIKLIPNAKYIFNGDNKGIAAALNQAAELAIGEKFEYLLTMDDDTEMPVGWLDEMRRFWHNYPQAEKIGILSGVHVKCKKHEPFKIVSYTMTSGNLLNLKAYKQVGAFRTDFFIDHVDHEYGLRLTKAGYKVIELPSLELRHELGERKKSGLGMHTFISHSPLRAYYIVRNGLEMARLFPDFRSRAIVLIVKELTKSILFETDKMGRLKFFAAGLVDGWRRKFGQYNSSKTV